MIDLAEQTTVLKGWHGGSSRLCKKMDLVIKGERIEALVNDFIMDETADCRIIDVSGKVILPGIIDTHVHMWDPSPFKLQGRLVFWFTMCSWKEVSQQLLIFAQCTSGG